jgi:hypothetical protein
MNLVKGFCPAVAFISIIAMCQAKKDHAKGCGEGEVETVLFALMEGGPQVIEALSRRYEGPQEDYLVHLVALDLIASYESAD